YLGFLSGLNKSNDQEIIQIWHANGAIKKFGLEANQNKARSNSAILRFKKVYSKIDTYVVASDEMEQIFRRNWDASAKKFLKFGYYGIDKLLDKNNIKECVNKILKQYPVILNKKVLLYAPTYREDKFNGLDIESLSEKISKDYIIIVKYHPHMKIRKFSNLKNVIVLDGDKVITDFLPIVDCLVTDYSSTIFEYSIISKTKKIYIYADDFIKYSQIVGLEDWFYKFYDCYRVLSVDDLCDKLINGGNFDDKLFNSIWHMYNKGITDESICNYLTKCKID
ncbi:MAG: CDP-glycerol glycerophosphotransferase family protein, partial [Bacilli bacterium]